jgi:hypothetical protein
LLDCGYVLRYDAFTRLDMVNAASSLSSTGGGVRRASRTVLLPSPNSQQLISKGRIYADKM